KRGIRAQGTAFPLGFRARVARARYPLGAPAMPLRRLRSLLFITTFALACDAHAPPKRADETAHARPAADAGAAAVADADGGPGAEAVAGPDAYPPPPPPDPPINLHSGGKNAVRGDAGIVSTVEINATHVGAGVL